MLHGRYAKAVRALFGLEATQVGILPELIPTVEVMPADGSTHFARGEHPYSLYQEQAAVAGQYSQLVFRNPADSSKIGIFEAVEVWSPTGGVGFFIRMERGGTAGATAVAVAARDPRVWSDVPPYPIPNSIEVSRGSTVALPGHNLALLVTTAANLKDQYVWPIMVVPGTTLYVVCGTLNNAIRTNVVWYERVIDGAEYG